MTTGVTSPDVTATAGQSALQTGLVCAPGDCLCAASGAVSCPSPSSRAPPPRRYSAGSGTYERAGYIRAMLAGRVVLTRAPTAAGGGGEGEQQQQGEEEGKFSVQVCPPGGATCSGDQLPTPGALVTCRVLSVGARNCRCDIVCVGDGPPLAHSLRAQLRREEARAVQREEVRLHECFRPGDLLLARVLSADETAPGATATGRYQLSTAEPELGVAMARGEAGAWLVPTSWTEMTCPLTQQRQLRKVAKIPPEDVARRVAAMKLTQEAS